jgi:type IV pilus assembly protein PilB
VSAKTGHELIAADEFPSSPLYAGHVSEKFLIDSCVLPISETEAGLVLAMADPLDRYAAEAMELVARRPVEPRVATERDIAAAVKRLYRNGAAAGGHTVEDAQLADVDLSVGDIERLKDMASEAPVIRLVNNILARALESRASDIHLEPFEDELVVRYRVDGILREVESPDPRLAAAIVSRVKIMARLNIAERRLAQDGRIRLRMMGKELDLRVSCVPNMHGESVVLRLLEHNLVALDFPALGLDEAGSGRLLEILSQRHGIMLVTGPTGSGKTVSLYTCLNILNQPGVNISTVEDPAEINLPGVNQVNVNDKAGLTFSAALKSFLRQDPDIIMVGEIRDLETADIAIKAAQTGHMVMSTLHTNDAPTTLTRLLNMGVAPFNIASSVLLITAQRLARKLCETCKTPADYPREAMLKAGFADHDLDGTWKPFRAVGCSACTNGYKGRVGIYQVMPITDEIQKIILNEGTSMDIATQAQRESVRDLRQSGLVKVRAGVTTLEEVISVTNE